MKDATLELLELGADIGFPRKPLDDYRYYKRRHEETSGMKESARKKYGLLADRTKLWRKYFKMNLQLFAAQTLYVRNGGNDSLSRAANSSSTPWAHCPGMAGWTGSAVLEAGDIVIFDNASTFSTSTARELATTVDGVSYDGVTWGTGTRAIFQCTATHDDLVLIIHNNITFTGVDCNASNTNGYGIALQSYFGTKAISNIEINNCIVRNMGATDTWMYAILVTNYPYTPSYTVTDCRIINNLIYDVNHEGIAIYPGTVSTAGAVNILVRGNTVYNTGRSSSSFGAGVLIKNNVNGLVVEFNHLYDNGWGVEFETGGSYSPINVDIRFNLIRSNKIAGVYILGAGSSQNYSADVYGNLFVKNADTNYGGGYGAEILFDSLNQASSVWNIYNNTFLSIECVQPTHHCLWIACSGSPTITVKNNIFYTDDHPCITDTGNKIGSNHSNNQFWRTSGASDTVVASSSNYNRTTVLSTWEPTCKSSNPNFKNILNLPTGFTGTYGTDKVPYADGLSIESGDAINNGYTLGSPYNGAINLSGISGGLTRPQGAVYDIGAYELTLGIATIVPSVFDAVSVRESIEPRKSSYAISYARVE